MNGLLGIKAFAAAVIGGLGSMPGAILGGLIVGIIEPFAAAYVPAVKGSMIYVVMLIVLALRPQGLFAQNHKKNQKYSNRAYIKKVNQQQKGNKRKRKK